METTETKKEHWTYEPLTKPAYLSFLRFFAGLELIVALVALVGFVLNLTSRQYGDSGSSWFLAIVIFLQGCLAFGVLNALADIAENLITIGRHYRAVAPQKDGKA